jgi:hypothetical protein
MTVNLLLGDMLIPESRPNVNSDSIFGRQGYRSVKWVQNILKHAVFSPSFNANHATLYEGGLSLYLRPPNGDVSISPKSCLHLVAFWNHRNCNHQCHILPIHSFGTKVRRSLKWHTSPGLSTSALSGLHPVYSLCSIFAGASDYLSITIFTRWIDISQACCIKLLFIDFVSVVSLGLFHRRDSA